MRKSNPYAKARKIAASIVTWVLVGIAALAFSALLIGSIVYGFIEGLPWYETFVFPLIILSVFTVMLGLMVGSLFIADWWKKLEVKWEKKHGE